MEELSPELVLVSSEEDARRAREQLPEPPWQAVAAKAEPQPTVRRRRRRRRGGRAAAIAVVGLAAAGIAGYFVETRGRDASVTPAAAQPTVAVRARTTAQPGFVPARTWRWTPRAHTDSYEVTFYLDGKVVLQAHPTEARYAMPRTFYFRAGHYRWTVIAVPPSANAKPLVDSSFVVTAASAVAANR